MKDSLFNLEQLEELFKPRRLEEREEKERQRKERLKTVTCIYYDYNRNGRLLSIHKYDRNNVLIESYYDE